MITEHSLSKQKSGRSCCCFPWQRMRVGVKKSMAKTVPLEEGLVEFDDIERLKLKAQTKLHSSSWKWRSKSKSKSKSNSLNNTQITSTLNQTLPKSRLKRENKLEHDTCQHAVYLPSSKRQQMVSSRQFETRKHVICTCLVVISLISMIVWGRLGSVVCTTSFMYLVSTFLNTTKSIPSLTV